MVLFLSVEVGSLRSSDALVASTLSIESSSELSMFSIVRAALGGVFFFKGVLDFDDFPVDLSFGLYFRRRLRFMSGGITKVFVLRLLL